MPLEALVAASDAGQISLRYYGELHPPPSPVSGRSFAEFAASLGEGRRHLGQLFAAFGIAEPDGAVVLTIEDEAVIREHPRCRGRHRPAGPRAARRPDVRRRGEAGRRRGARGLRRGRWPARVRPRGPARRRAVRQAAPAVGSLRAAVDPARGLAVGPAPEPGHRRVQHRRERAHPPGVGLRGRARRYAAGGGVRRPHGLHATDRGAGRRRGGGDGDAPGRRLDRHRRASRAGAWSSCSATGCSCGSTTGGRP